MSLEEKLEQVKGSVKEGLGKLTGDEKLEKEGTAEKVIAKVKEVAKGFECGITLENYQDIKEKDIIEAYELKEIKKI